LHPGTRRTLFRKKKLKIIKDIISSLWYYQIHPKY
jgi:hypothetical protein